MECMKAAQHRESNLSVGKFFLLEHDSKRVHNQTPRYANCIQHGNDGKILLPVTIRAYQHEQADAGTYKQSREHRSSAEHSFNIELSDDHAWSAIWNKTNKSRGKNREIGIGLDK